MSVTTRADLKEYCLRELGKPVLKINIDDSQLEDRIDEALSYFKDYHYDGIEKIYLKHQVTSDDITNGWFPLDDSISGVIKVYPIGGLASGNGLFSAKFQLIASNIQNLANIDLVGYETTRQYISLLDDVLTGHKIYRFNRLQNKLFIDQKWDEETPVGSYILVECYAVINPNIYTKMWNDRWLKQYTTALFKRQWGVNIRKFSGIALPGGATLDGQAIYEESISEIKDLEDNLMNTSGVLEFFVG